jgi:hypothetical protein
MTDEEAKLQAEKILDDFEIMIEEEYMNNFEWIELLSSKVSAWKDGFKRGYICGKEELT